MHTAFRLDREDVAGSGRSAKSAPSPASLLRCNGLSQGRNRSSPWRIRSRALRTRFGDDRSLIGLKIGLLAILGILMAVLDLTA